MRHKPFLVLADYLPSKGIAVLRADGGGIGNRRDFCRGHSRGNFATDAEAGSMW